MCPILELIQTLKDFFFLTLTSIALSCAQSCAQLLQPLVQFLLWSPGTLTVTACGRWTVETVDWKTTVDSEDNHNNYS